MCGPGAGDTGGSGKSGLSNEAAGKAFAGHTMDSPADIASQAHAYSGRSSNSAIGGATDSSGGAARVNSNHITTHNSLPTAVPVPTKNPFTAPVPTKAPHNASNDEEKAFVNTGNNPGNPNATGYNSLSARVGNSNKSQSETSQATVGGLNAGPDYGPPGTNASAPPGGYPGYGPPGSAADAPQGGYPGYGPPGSDADAPPGGYPSYGPPGFGAHAPPGGYPSYGPPGFGAHAPPGGYPSYGPPGTARSKDDNAVDIAAFGVQVTTDIADIAIDNTLDKASKAAKLGAKTPFAALNLAMLGIELADKDEFSLTDKVDIGLAVVGTIAIVGAAVAAAPVAGAFGVAGVFGAIGGIATGLGFVSGGLQAIGFSDWAGELFPVILDLDGEDGVEITDLSQSSFFFDGDNDGLKNNTAWAGAGDAVLFYDPNGYNEIKETSQFVFTEWDPTADNDLDAVRSVFDENGDGKLTAADAEFAFFKLMVTNEDGTLTVQTLLEAGITELDLNPDATVIRLPDGSEIIGQTTFTRSDGSTGIIANTVLAADGNSYHVEQINSTAADGTRTQETKGYSADGDLAFSIDSTFSADGSDIRHEYDDNGDGTVDRIQTIVTTTNLTGETVKTVENWTGVSEASGVLEDKEVATTSVDGNTITIERDSNGGGWFDEIETRITQSDGTLSITVLELAEDGSTIFSSADIVSADGKTRTQSVDMDGDGTTDVSTSHAITELGTGERIDTTTLSNGDATLRSTEVETTSADGRQRVVQLDLDGDGDFDTTTTSNIAVATDQSTTSIVDITNEDGSLRTSSTTTQSGDARSKQIALDQDGDRLTDLTTSEVTTIVNNVRTNTLTLLNGDGSVRSKIETILDADGVGQETKVDLNQDGVFGADEWTNRVTVDGVTGERTSTTYERNADGSWNAKTISITSEDGLSTTIEIDVDGDGDNDQLISDITVTNPDGSSLRTIETRNQDNSLSKHQTIESSANGLTTTTRTDIDGDGVLESVSKSIITQHADGSTTTILEEFAGDGVTLLSKSETFESSDRLSVTVSIDENGDGHIDQTEAYVTAADGARSETITRFNPDGTINNITANSVSANGLVTTSSVDANADALNEASTTTSRVYNADGSVTDTIDTNNGNGSDRSLEIITTSDDGLHVVSQFDSDGNGSFERVTDALTTLNGDGSRTTVTEVLAEDGSVVSIKETSVSDDGLTITNRRDRDGDGTFDLTETVTTSLAQNGDTTVTRELRESNGALREKTVETSSDNARDVTETIDGNGDGLADIRRVTSVADDGVATVTDTALDANGDTQSETVTTTSANGLSETTEFDLDGDGVFEMQDATNITLNADGSTTTVASMTASSGALISRTETIVSDDELVSVVQEDLDGDAVFDFVTTTQTDVHFSGGRTLTETVHASNGNLAQQRVVTTSADQRNILEALDLDGDGQNDVETTSALADDGTLTVSTSHYSTAGNEYSKYSETVSSDALSIYTEIDDNADGKAELTILDQTVLDEDGSFSQTITYSDYRYVKLGEEAYDTSDDGLITTSKIDLNGDGIYEFRGSDVTTLNSDGSTTSVMQTLNSSFDREVSITSTTSGNGLVTSALADFDGDTNIDRSFSRVEDAEGGWVETYEFLSAGNSTLRTSRAEESADGLSSSVELDDDGDGRIDYRSETEIDPDGDVTSNHRAFSFAGETIEHVEMYMSANGHYESYSFDVNGDGLFDFSRVITQSYLADGALVSDRQDLDQDGNLISSAITTSAANGLSSSTQVDHDGDGDFDSTTVSNTQINADGSRTTVSQSTYADGGLRNSSKETSSYDGRTTTFSADYDGNALDDFTNTTAIQSDGSLKTINTVFSTEGRVLKKEIIESSADGLETRIVDGETVQTTTYTPGSTGSYTYEFDLDRNSSDIDFTSTHEIDSFGVDRWSVSRVETFTQTVWVNYGEGSGTYATTTGSQVINTNIQIDEEAKATAFVEAEAIYDTLFDRDMNAFEYELLAENISEGLLDREDLITSLLDSNEFNTRYGQQSDAEFIQQIYLNSFDRAATLDELANRLEDLSSNTSSREAVAEDIAFSNEHKLVGNGHRLTNNSNKDQSLLDFERPLDTLYVQTLVVALVSVAYGRAATDFELEAYTRRILENEETLFDVAEDLITHNGDLHGVASNSLNGLNNLQFVEAALENAFGDNASSEMIAEWVSQINSGNLTKAEFITSLAQSPEHLGIVGNNAQADVASVNAVKGSSIGETVNGTTDQDKLEGLDGNDTLYAGNGADLLIGGAGDDYLRGDAGSDRYEWSKGDGNDQLYDYNTSLFDTDTLALLDVNPDDVSLARTNGSADLRITVLSTGEVITVTNQFNSVTNGYGLETIEFADGTVWTWNDINSQTSVTGTNAAETLTGRDHADNLYGLDGNDTINGQAGNDTIVGGLGDDNLDGGLGSDRYEWSKGDGDDRVYDSNTELGAVDTLALIDVNSDDVAFTRAHGSADLKIEIISTTETITVTNQFNTVDNGYGLEQIEFADGVIWSSQDIQDQTTVSGSATNNTLYGRDHDDTILGLEGDDNLYGYAGDDTIVGGLGDDYLDGGADSDVYLWTTGDGNDQLYDNSTSLTSVDRLVLTDVTFDDVTLFRDSVSTSQTVTQSVWVGGGGEGGGYWGSQTYTATVGPDNPNGLLLTVNSTGETITVTNRFHSPSQGYGIEAIEFADGVVWDLDDILAKTEASGSAADETLTGTGYADNLLGLDGTDTINGHAGDDTLVGGLGTDSLDGGVGNDRYEWSKGDGNDTIYDTHTSLTDVDALVFDDVMSTEVDLTQIGSNLNIEIIPTNEDITVTNRFYSSGSGYGIEIIAFADGVITEVLDSEVAETITTGTAANNTLYGWGFKDTINGGDGNDHLYGHGGVDTLNGGLGQDHLDGGAGSDVYVWQHLDGNDTIYDTSTSLTSVDRLVLTDVTFDDVTLFRDSVTTTETVTQTGWIHTGWGEYSHSYWGTQTVVTTVGPDNPNALILKVNSTGETITITNRFYGPTHGYGIEEIEFADGTVWGLNEILARTEAHGGADDETLTGTGYSDNLLGLEGNDTINGQAGDDMIVGGLGDDNLDGGVGNDRYEWSKGDGNDQLYDSNTALDVVDTLALLDVNSSDVSFTRAHGSADLKIEVISTGEIITVTNQYNSVTNGYGLEKVEFADGVVWNVEDIQDQTTVSGTAAANTIYGKDHGDNIFGLEGNDSIYGYAGDDTIVGGLGEDYLDGGIGNDLYHWSTGDGDDQIYDSSTSLTNIDRLVFSDVNSNDITLFRDSVSTSQTVTQTVWVSGGPEGGGYWTTQTYTTTVGPNNPNGLLLTVNSTGETITITNRFLNPTQGYGIEQIEFADGIVWGLDDILAKTEASGSAADETLTGTGYADNLLGLDGTDTINGQAGDDMLVGGLGVDSLDGGVGNDRYEWSKGDGNDTIYDTHTSLLDTDTLALLDVNADEIAISKSGSNVILDVIPTGESIQITNQLYTTSYGYGVEEIELADGVTINLDHGPNIELLFKGTENDDTINGWDHAESILGLAGNDTINAKNGDDIIDGGAGDDDLIGGSGADIFEFGDNFGSDIIHDFENGTDILSFVGNSSVDDFSDLIIIQSGLDTLIQDGVNTLTLKDVDVSLIGTDDFLF